MSVLSISSSGVGTYGGLERARTLCTVRWPLCTFCNCAYHIQPAPTLLLCSFAYQAASVRQASSACRTAVFAAVRKLEDRDLTQQDAGRHVPADPPCAACQVEGVKADCLAKGPHPPPAEGRRLSHRHCTCGNHQPMLDKQTRGPRAY